MPFSSWGSSKSSSSVSESESSSGSGQPCPTDCSDCDDTMLVTLNNITPPWWWPDLPTQYTVTRVGCIWWGSELQPSNPGCSANVKVWCEDGYWYAKMEITCT